MKTQIQAGPAGRGRGSRSAMSGALRYMSERQTQAYLLSRDTIRRIQRTASIVEAVASGRSVRLDSQHNDLTSQ